MQLGARSGIELVGDCGHDAAGLNSGQGTPAGEPSTTGKGDHRPSFRVRRSDPWVLPSSAAKPRKSFLDIIPHAGTPPCDDEMGIGSLPAPSPRLSRQPQANFGDIMPSFYADLPIHDTFGAKERMVLSANGNLQRLISSFYNKPVSVHIRYNRPVEGAKGKYDREVEMDVAGKIFGVATSFVQLGHDDLIDAVENKGVAIGQLFRHYRILPTFRLLSCSKEPSGAFQRTYLLEGAGVSCKICEKFVPHLFDLFATHVDAETEPGDAGPAADSQTPEPPSPGFRALRRPSPSVSQTSSEGTKERTPASKAKKHSQADGHFGDIMATNKTGIELPDSFEPMQRVLLTANGNFERLVSSFYENECTTELVSSAQNVIGSHDRVLRTSLHSETIMIAKWTVHLTSHEWIDAYDAGVGLGQMFQHFQVLPTFQLHSCGKFDSYFWRSYSLVAEGMVCEVHESIDGLLCNEALGVIYE